ncbi:hypothetical protein [Pyrobaculum sp.]|uniref:hypothetical protein n=1 Tax=Pyrobaculum sp. TaxID=2004705 RepID=UPI00315FFB4F
MDEVLDSAEEVKYDLCVLVLSKNADLSALEPFKDVEFAVVLAAECRGANPPVNAPLYICTYLPGELRPGAKPIGPLKMLDMCRKIWVL